MNDKEKIEEAHGLWELAIVRLSAMVYVKAHFSFIAKALDEERAAFAEWQAVFNRATNKP